MSQNIANSRNHSGNIVKVIAHSSNELSATAVEKKKISIPEFDVTAYMRTARPTNPIKKDMFMPLINPEDVVIGDELDIGETAPLGYALF
jgi:hypothetical protein